MYMHRLKYLVLTFMPVVVLLALLHGSVYGEEEIAYTPASQSGISLSDGFSADAELSVARLPAEIAAAEAGLVSRGPTKSANGAALNTFRAKTMALPLAMTEEPSGLRFDDDYPDIHGYEGNVEDHASGDSLDGVQMYYFREYVLDGNNAGRLDFAFLNSSNQYVPVLMEVTDYRSCIDGDSANEDRGAFYDGNRSLIAKYVDTIPVPVFHVAHYFEGACYDPWRYPQDGYITFRFYPADYAGLLDRMVWSAEPECPTCSSQSAVGWAGGPINTRNGNLSYQVTDLSIPVMGGEVSFKRSYASGAVTVYSDTLGHGWTHNYDLRLHFDNNALEDTVEFQAAGGSRLPFYINGDGTYSPYPGVTAELIYIAPTYVITAFNQTRYEFDSAGLLLEQTDPHGNVITFTYDSGRLSRAAQGNRYLDYSYAGDRLTRVQDHSGRKIRLTYTGDDLVNSTLVGVNDSLILTSTYAYSGTDHLLTKVTDPSGTTVEETAYICDGEDCRAYRQWDGQGNLLVDIDYSQPYKHLVIENGVAMTHTYAVHGTLLDSTFSCSGGTSGCGQGTIKAYDDNFKVKEVVDVNNNRLQMAWNASGSNLEQVTDALGNETAFVYDDLNNLTQVTNARDGLTSYAYGNASQPSFRTIMTDALDYATIYTPTADGLLSAKRDPNGVLTTYDYNDYGQVKQVVQAAGSPDAITTLYGYDSVGRLITTTQASATESLTNLTVYDDADRPLATIANWTGGDPDAWRQDCVNTGDARDENACTRFLYDGAGRAISTTNPLGQTDLTFYDGAGRVVTSVVNYAGTTGHSQLCASFSEPDPEYNICSLTGYDSHGRVSSTTDSLGRLSRTFYDSLGRVAGTINSSVAVTDLANCSFPPASPDQDLCTVYEYDAVGNTIVVTDPEGRKTRTFYDELNRVVGTIENWSESISSQSQLSSCLELPVERDEDICTLYSYDEVGNTTVVTDTLGRMTRTFYDELSRVEATVENWTGALSSPENCSVSSDNEEDADICTLYGYDPAGNQVTTTNALSQTALTVYDAANRPFITVANWDGTPIDNVNDCQFPPAVADVNLCTVTAYNDLGRRASTKDALGNVTEFDYDGLGRIITTTRHLDGQPVETSITYDALGNRLSETDPEGNTTTYRYDSLNRLRVTISAEGVVVTRTYDAAGQVITTTDGLKHATTNRYDGQGRLLSTTDPLEHVTQYQYDALGNQVAMIDAEGVTTTYEYDGLNRLAAVIENDTGAGQSDDSNVRTRYRYDALGNRTVITNALNHTSTLTIYDGLNRPVSVKDALGNETTYRYNAIGSRMVITDANLEVTLFDYDGLNRQTSAEYLSDNEAVAFSYDAAGNRVSTIDGLGTTSYGYDDLYRLITVTNSITGTVGYGYDLAGNRSRLTYPDGKVVTYTYDGDRRMVQVEDWNEGLTRYGYGTIGRLITTTLPSGIQTDYGYDAAGRLTSLIHRSATGELLASYNYQLDQVGNRVLAQERLLRPEVEEAAAGESTGGAESSTSPLPGETIVAPPTPEPPQGYPAPNMGEASTSMEAYPGPSLSGSSSAVPLTAPIHKPVASPAGGQEASSGTYYFYLPLVMGSCSSEYACTTIEYEYDPLSRLTEAEYNGTITATYQYDYDAVGNMKFITQTVGLDTTRVQRYFNGANQLIDAFDYDLGTTIYTYDKNGNLTEIRPPGESLSGTVRYGYDQRNLLITGTLYISGTGWVNQVDYAYDGAGDRARQVDYTGAQPVITTYANDIAGLTQVLAAADGTRQTANLFGLDLVLQDSGTATRTLLTDGLGSVRTEVVSDSVETAATYSPYGKVLRQEGDSGTVYGFTGEQYDNVVGLLYLRARYYSPESHTFMNRDKWVGSDRRPQSLGFNYLYVLNNPSNLTDPSGHDPWWCEDPACVSNYYGFDFNPRDLTLWLYREMKANTSDPVVQTLRNKNLVGKGGIGIGAGVIACGFWLDGPFPLVEAAGGVVALGGGIVYADALLQFRDQVKNGARWDFKDEIGLKIGPGFTLCSPESCASNIEYSVPGNIFFGYIGRAAGFTGLELNAGAAWAEWRDPAHDPTSEEYSGPYEGERHFDMGRPGLWNLGDEETDHAAVMLGILLWDNYGERMTLGQFKTLLGEHVGHLSRHVPDLGPVNESVAREWPYSVGSFDNIGRIYVPKS